jgi:hypothetical protein
MKVEKYDESFLANLSDADLVDELYAEENRAESSAVFGTDTETNIRMERITQIGNELKSRDKKGRIDEILSDLE